MADEADIKELNSKLEAFREKIEKHDRYFWVAIAVGAVFGLTGAYGARWIDRVSAKVTSAEEKVNAVDKNIDEKYAEAQRKAEKNIDTWVNARQSKLEVFFRDNTPQINDLSQKVNNLGQTLAGMKTPVEIVDGTQSKSAGGANAEIYSSLCSPGQVVVGLEVSLGGTCHGECDGDGRPVHYFRVKCGRRL